MRGKPARLTRQAKEPSRAARRRDAGEARLWPFGAALGAGVLAAVLGLAGLTWLAWVLLHRPRLPQAGTISVHDTVGVLQLVFASVAGAGALVALIVAYRRQKIAEADSAHDRTRVFNERFTAIADQLGEAKAAVRLAGVHAMAGLADDWQDHRQTCVDVLCAYLRMPYEPEPGDDAPVETRLDFQASREVRHTVIRVIAAHLNGTAPVSWCGLNFDFTGVVFDGGDFTGAEFSGGQVSFRGAVFSASGVSLSSLSGVVFEGSGVSFNSARFSGEAKVSFYRAAFSGGEVSFAGAAFSDEAKVFFSSAAFSGEAKISFRDAVFSGGEVSFYLAKFSGEAKVSFGGAAFSGGKVSFIGAAFSGGEVSFANAKFSGGEVSFNGAGFWVELSFYNAAFSGGQVSFGAGFSGGAKASFNSAAFSGGEVTFSRAEFSGGEVDLSAPVDWSHPPDFGPGFDMSRPPPGVTLPAAASPAAPAAPPGG